MKNKKVKIFLISIGILMAGIAYICGCGFADFGSNTAFQLDETSQTATDSSETDGNTEQQPNHKESESASEALGIFVHVCGEVDKPGVYEMEPGNRVFEAVERAGGFTDKAALDYLNLAQPLTDGMKITVPDKELVKTLLESEGMQETESGGGKVNLNTATKEQLMTLRGVGEARAADIIAYRQQNGPFKKVEDIMGVSGIKEAAFQKIKENITV